MTKTVGFEPAHCGSNTPAPFNLYVRSSRLEHPENSAMRKSDYDLGPSPNEHTNFKDTSSKIKANGKRLTLVRFQHVTPIL